MNIIIYKLYTISLFSFLLLFALFHFEIQRLGGGGSYTHNSYTPVPQPFNNEFLQEKLLVLSILKYFGKIDHNWIMTIFFTGKWIVSPDVSREGK